ncbi:Werner Syndrome-like exonuclease [Morella rubra]|uniref:Werner Syndrome-like exonuclease n=1 Tax=Morella rubra TaxID=262757 RepID=A0A6A1VV97_9ROSI|nr:Werner Syndrome-like exonuclease [Morella rubra]
MVAPNPFVICWNTTLVGLDTEWSLLPNKKAAVLQLCVDERCLIIQLVYMEDNIPLSTLESFLTDSNFTFVGIEVAQDIAKLKHEYGLECNKSMDIGRLAKRRWPGRFRGPSLKELASELLGIDMRKPEDVCLSNWEAKVLNENQIEYACIDAYASYRIGHKLLLGEGALNL